MEENLSPDIDLSVLDYADGPEEVAAAAVEEDHGPHPDEGKKPPVDPIMEEFQYLEGRPSDEQIDQWKGMHGKVFTAGFDADDYYIFRPMRRQEWRQLLKTLDKQPDEAKRKEAVVMQATLWPNLKTPGAMASLSAGTPDTLYELILQASNFLMPQDALTLVRKL